MAVTCRKSVDNLLRVGKFICPSGFESIPNPRFAEDIARLAARLDLLAQLRHQHPQVLRLVQSGAAPDRQQRLVGQHAVCIANEVQMVSCAGLANVAIGYRTQRFIIGLVLLNGLS